MPPAGLGTIAELLNLDTSDITALAPHPKVVDRLREALVSPFDHPGRRRDHLGGGDMTTSVFAGCSRISGSADNLMTGYFWECLRVQCNFDRRLVPTLGEAIAVGRSHHSEANFRQYAAGCGIVHVIARLEPAVAQ